jgi:hypothetical protein
VNIDLSLLNPGGNAGHILQQSAHATKSPSTARSLHEMWDELS